MQALLEHSDEAAVLAADPAGVPCHAARRLWLGVGQLVECVGDELVAFEGGAACEAVLGVAAGPEGGDGVAALLDELRVADVVCFEMAEEHGGRFLSPYPCPVERQGLHDDPHQRPGPGGEQTREGVV